MTRRVSVSFLLTAAILVSMAYLPFVTATPPITPLPNPVDAAVAHPYATQFPFQRKTFFDAEFGHHYVFYSDGTNLNPTMAYRSAPPAGAPWSPIQILGGPGWPANASFTLTGYGWLFSLWYEPPPINTVIYVRVAPTTPTSMTGPQLIYNWGSPQPGGFIIWAGEVVIPSPDTGVPPPPPPNVPGQPVPLVRTDGTSPASVPFVFYHGPTITVTKWQPGRTLLWDPSEIYVSVRMTTSSGALPILMTSSPTVDNFNNQRPAWTHYAYHNMYSPTWWTTVVRNERPALGKVTALAASTGSPIFVTLANAAGPFFLTPWGPPIIVMGPPVGAFGAFSAVAVLDQADPAVGMLGTPDIVHIAYADPGLMIWHAAVGAIQPLPTSVVEPVNMFGPPMPTFWVYPSITADTTTAPNTLYVRWALDSVTFPPGGVIVDVAGAGFGTLPVAPTQPLIGLPAPPLAPFARWWWGTGSLTSFYYSYGGFEGTAVTENLIVPFAIEYAAT